MTIAEQAQAAFEALSDEHRGALERWAEVAEEHAVLLAFLDWAINDNFLRVATGVGISGVDVRELVNIYLKVDEDLADAARRALLSGETP